VSSTNIHCSQIIKKWQETWFHYATETCPLKVTDVYDHDYKYVDTGTDEYCYYHHEYYDVWGWEEQENDYHDHYKCIWSGPGMVFTMGHYAEWDPTSACIGAYGVSVWFDTDDYSSAPSPAVCGNTVDDDAIYRSIRMYAYEAVAYLNCGSSNSGYPTTGPIYESTGSDDSITLSLAEDQVIADSDGEVEYLSAYGSAEWILSTRPDVARLDSCGQLKSDIGLIASSSFYQSKFWW